MEQIKASNLLKRETRVGISRKENSKWANDTKESAKEKRSEKRIKVKIINNEIDGFRSYHTNIARATKAMLDPLYHPRHILPLASNLGTFRVRKTLAKEKIT